MKFIPLTVTDELIPRILDGTKLVTRRLLNPQPRAGTMLCMLPADFEFPHERGSWHHSTISCKPNGPDNWVKEYGIYQPGDVLWIKETHYSFGEWVRVEGEFTTTGRQKMEFINDPHGGFTRFSPPEMVMTGHTNQAGYYKRLARFMPKKFCRTFLEIEDVRIERVNTITEEDARLEGAGKSVMPYFTIIDNHNVPSPSTTLTYVGGFCILWEKLHGLGTWLRGDWVYRIKYRVIDKPNNFLP